MTMVAELRECTKPPTCEFEMNELIITMSKNKENLAWGYSYRTDKALGSMPSMGGSGYITGLVLQCQNIGSRGSYICLCEFKTKLVYRDSYRIVRATRRNPISKDKTKQNQEFS